MIAIVLVSNWVINNLFLERYYMMKKQKVLINTYEQLNETITTYGLNEEIVKENMGNIFGAENISLLVLNQDMKTCLYTSNINKNLMAGRLYGYLVGVDNSNDSIIKRNEYYTLQRNTDMESKQEYLELWGVLDNAYAFLMRVPLESIRSNAKISNEFLAYISIVVIAISTIMLSWLSKKITKPILELTELSKRMAELDFDAKYSSGGNDEIGQLGEHFNKMSETLEMTISELKTANNELQQDIEKKTQVDEMRKEFLSNVSHELKTPIALIQGYAEGLQECINDDEESREFYCSVIMDEAAKMNNMVKKLLTLNQLEFGNEKVMMERFDLTTLIRGVVQSAEILAQQKEAKIRFSQKDPVHVWADEFKVEEVVTNYISNALNHVDYKKIIDVKIKKKEDGKVRVSVFNTGDPIPEEDMPNIWIKFYKVDKARTREYGGSGIGLSIVKAIMDSFHQECGAINYKNGVEFWFELDGDAEAEGKRENE
ncbi:MAG: HAMP domain-containing histidine kinase [Robinsoniella sp.]|nr:HAMP domain-containing histidine kinase [Robinsoniella sp.]